MELMFPGFFEWLGAGLLTAFIAKSEIFRKKRNSRDEKIFSVPEPTKLLKSHFKNFGDHCLVEFMNQTGKLKSAAMLQSKCVSVEPAGRNMYQRMTSKPVIGFALIGTEYGNWSHVNAGGDSVNDVGGSRNA